MLTPEQFADIRGIIREELKSIFERGVFISPDVIDELADGIMDKIENRSRDSDAQVQGMAEG